ncbi:sucrose-phosphate phosphatase [Tolypothrix sp. FACHB-123]|uniref:sucrose-phosphate phosphatase n=1 Tax=Tolypothrix sp. FACHB-123 TaxID=2692868 RepID=UPI001685D8C4|nr:sucrose-phosphate phosphatase [Tolypothrix sp. FACHB-123]MBD2358339.1 sucrose-phosphate phosphatase [Tolypothrix sp. FACHB-123]
MKLLLVIDLDNTLVEKDKGTNFLTQRLAEFRKHIYLVYITEETDTSSRKFIAQSKLLKPDYLITSLGSEIYQQGVILEQDWANYLSQGWNRDTIWAIASQFSGLKVRSQSEQTRWKISLSLDMAASLHVIDDLQDLLDFSGLSTQVIFSNGRDVDIVPKNCNKGKAAAYVQQLLQVEPEATVICGGSGNDISLFKLPSPGIIVSNAQTELLQWYYKTHYPWHYLTYYPDAAGIVEGLVYFNILAFPNSWRSQSISNS